MFHSHRPKKIRGAQFCQVGSGAAADHPASPEGVALKMGNHPKLEPSAILGGEIFLQLASFMMFYDGQSLFELL